MSRDIKGYVTVEDVIKELQKYPKDMIVKVMDSEADMVDISEISETSETYRRGDDIYFAKFVALWPKYQNNETDNQDE